MHLLRNARPFTPDNASPIAIATTLLVASTVAFITVSPTESLHQHAFASLLAFGILSWRKKSIRLCTRDESPNGVPVSTQSAWTAGVLLAISQLAQRASSGSESTRWALALLPLWNLASCLKSSSISTSTTLDPSLGLFSSRFDTNQVHLLFVSIASVSSLLVFHAESLEASGIAIGVLYALSLGLSMDKMRDLANCGYDSAMISLGEKTETTLSATSILDFLHNVVSADMFLCGISAFLFERAPEKVFSARFLSGLALQLLMLVSFMFLVCKGALEPTEADGHDKHGRLEASEVLLMASVAASVLSRLDAVALGLGTLILLLLFLSSTAFQQHESTTSSRRSFRIRAALSFLLAAGFVISGMSLLLNQRTQALHSMTSAIATSFRLSQGVSQPVELEDPTIHPIEFLTARAQAEFDASLAGQSRSLAEAAVEYKRRYGLHPPPLFDKWYEFARKYDVEMIDEFDTIHDTLMPFWALPPAILRQRVTEALGYENNGLIALLIRNGKVALVAGGQVWQQESLRGLVSKFVHLLPDLDIAFNMHDEPRIMIPHDELSKMVAYAKDIAMPSALAQRSPRNSFSARPTDLGASDRIAEVTISRFNEYAHQNTWVPSRLSCSPDSPSRDFNAQVAMTEPFAFDNLTSYAVSPLGFIHNLTAATDVCSLPSLPHTHAFFNRPNAFKVAHELIPIFSESKVSSFQDILFPSMWHWNRRIPAAHNRTEDMHLPGLSQPMYDPSADALSWNQKQSSLYWRGSTTGGFSVNGAWRSHHRQRLVRQTNAPDRTRILLPSTASNNSSRAIWSTQTIPRSTLSSLFNVSFAGVGQCAPADCHAQEEFFTLSPYCAPAEAWRYRHLLDMDGNAFSARFYALLESGGLVHKMAMFREWHDEWLRPWVHYAPLSLQGTEWSESVRYLAGSTGPGERIAKEMATRGRNWAKSQGRREVLEAWMFRILIEYARVVDDARERVGFVG